MAGIAVTLIEWVRSRGHDAERIYAWLHSHGHCSSNCTCLADIGSPDHAACIEALEDAERAKTPPRAS